MEIIAPGICNRVEDELRRYRDGKETMSISPIRLAHWYLKKYGFNESDRVQIIADFMKWSK